MLEMLFLFLTIIRFAEDYGMFAERHMLTKQQIIDEFYEYLSEKEREALDTYYQYSATTSRDRKSVV